MPSKHRSRNRNPLLVLFTVSALFSVLALMGAMSTESAAQGAGNPNAGYSASILGLPQYSCVHNWYLSPTGDDSNSGKSPSSPWFTMNRADQSVQPGDCVNLAPGTYAYTPSSVPHANSTPVTLTHGGNMNTSTGYVVYRSSTPDGARITLTGPLGHSIQNGLEWSDLVNVNASYMIFDGIEFDGNNGDAYFDCISSSATTTLHHIVVENSIVHGCGTAGIANNFDYEWIVNNVVYNNSTLDYQVEGSGIDINVPHPATDFTPNANDNALQYHIMVAFNISHNNFVAPSGCTPPNGGPAGCGTGAPPNFDQGTTHTDGNGIILDTWNAVPYTLGGLVIGNIVYNNGGAGIQVLNTPNAMIANNTAYDNNLDSQNYGQYRGEITCVLCANSNFINNVAYAVVGPSGSPTSNNAAYWNDPSSGVTFTTNIGYAPGGTCVYGSSVGISCTNPDFVNATGANFSLQSGSPAIGAGTSESWLQSGYKTIGQVQRQGQGGEPIVPGVVYQLTNANSGMCVTDPRGRTTSPTHWLEQVTCGTSPASSQQWQFVPTSYGYYAAQNYDNAGALVWDDTNGGTGVNQIQLYTASTSNNSNQEWQPTLLSNVNNGLWTFMNDTSQYCLDNTGSSNSGTSFYQNTCADINGANGDTNQEFQMTTSNIAAGVVYEVVNVNSGMCVTNPATSGTLEQINCGDLLPSQEWMFGQSAYSGYFAIYNHENPQWPVWDNGGAGQQVSQLQLATWDNTNDQDQSWQPTQLSNGYWTFTNHYSGYCLDNGGSTASGAPFYQNSCANINGATGDTNQEFKVLVVQ